MSVNKFMGLYVLAVPAVMIWASCGGNNGEGDDVMSDTAAVIEDTVVEMEPEDEMDFILPSPLQIASIFKRSGLQYQPGVSNSVNNLENYTTSWSQSMAFGVYSADLSYAVLNGQSQEGLEYLKVIKQLSDKLGLSEIFGDEQLFKSFENNLGNEDSMMYILGSVQEQMDEYLDDTGQQYKNVIFYCGAWVEGMYIGSRVANNSDKSALTRRLVEQMTILDNLIKGLDYQPSTNEDIETLRKDLGDIKVVFENFEAIKAYNPDEDEPDFESLTITDDELLSLTQKIQEIRTKIVNG